MRHVYEASKPSPSLQLALLWILAPRDPNEVPSAPPQRNMDAHERTHAYIHQLHVFWAHLLHYEESLADFRKTVAFLVDTNTSHGSTRDDVPGPGMQIS
ncbi:uncharacterized protein BT62DRAFT_936997 [Guyanagaster necrorhizus]|uniref:Uncharacterized protein n=1 Tax=Guyanagaster necrorhizus TaxID=856835 RepID=A0A9P7VIT8_9AGAR|nr:uncharacterized protein BT62DRAFT_936997 [Guyanagaster necrorhizus MCA 3950]KAG7441474.1 hypothetical protein BT62DRAFT_936997 [Guyanagaster necrorhizus MCA 3950]